MDALIVIFLSGLISLFLGLLKKPSLALVMNLVGLTAAFVLMYNYNGYVSPLQNYANALAFNGPQLYFSLMAIVFTMLTLLVGYVSQSKDVNHYADLTSLLMFSLTGAICLIGFKDFFMFFLGLEILSIPVYVLVGSRKDQSISSEAALKYFFTGSFATAILLFGIGLVFGATGSFQIQEIGFAVVSGLYTPSLMLIGIFMIIAALLFKVGAVPFHFWNPDVYQGSPKPVMAYMSTVVKIAGFIAFFKLIRGTFGTISDQWMYFMYVVIIASLFIGYLSGLRQSSFKRLLAYSGISNTGLALLAVVSGTDFSERNLFLFLLSYGAATFILIAISIALEDEEDKIQSFEGIGYKNPILGVFLLISLLSLSGIPPFSGFFGKFLLIQDIIENHPVLGIAAVVSSVIGAFIYIRLLLSIFKQDANAKKIKLKPMQSIVLSASAIAILCGWLLIL